MFALRISIFLSIFNVHINRAPRAGRVVAMQYKPGEFLNALNPESAIRKVVFENPLTFFRQCARWQDWPLEQGPGARGQGLGERPAGKPLAPAK